MREKIRMNNQRKNLLQLLCICVPTGAYQVDRDALRKARAKVPKGEYHVDRDALRKARAKVPKGEYHVDRDALRKARAKVPKGEYHSCLLYTSPSPRD